jgi:hypothetical protein
MRSAVRAIMTVESCGGICCGVDSYVVDSLKLLVQFLGFVTRCRPLGVNHVGERSLIMSAERT